MNLCIHATSLLLLWSTWKCIITVVWVLVILLTLWSHRSSQSPEQTLDIIVFVRLHCDTWDLRKAYRQIGVVLGKVFVQIPFPKHHFTFKTLHKYIRTGFLRIWLFPPCRLTSIFVRQGLVRFHLLDQFTIVLSWVARRSSRFEARTLNGLEFHSGKLFNFLNQYIFFGGVGTQGMVTKSLSRIML